MKGKGTQQKIVQIFLFLLIFSRIVNASEINLNKKYELTASIGLLQIINLQFFTNLKDKLWLGSGIGYTVSPKIRQSCGAEVFMDILGVDINMKYKFKNKNFYGNIGLGYQKISINTEQTNISFYKIKDWVDVYLISPSIGWEKIFSSNILVGIELGLQIPFYSKINQDKEGIGYYTPETENQVKSGLNNLSTLPIPRIKLIKIGYKF